MIPGNMRKLRPASNITNRKNMPLMRPQMRVHPYPALIIFNPGLLQIQPVDIGSTPDRHQ